MDFAGLGTVLGAVVVGGMAGFAAGAAMGWLSNWALAARVDGVERRIKAVHMADLSPAGVAARREKAERMELVFAEVFQALQARGPNGEKPDVAAVLKAAAAKYPDVALALGKKIMAGKNIGGLEKWVAN